LLVPEWRSAEFLAKTLLSGTFEDSSRLEGSTSRTAWRANRRARPPSAEAAARALGDAAPLDGSGPLAKSVAIGALEAPPCAAWSIRKLGLRPLSSQMLVQDDARLFVWLYGSLIRMRAKFGAQ
jgi:hypothetical protein